MFYYHYVQCCSNLYFFLSLYAYSLHVRVDYFIFTSFIPILCVTNWGCLIRPWQVGYGRIRLGPWSLRHTVLYVMLIATVCCFCDSGGLRGAEGWTGQRVEHTEAHSQQGQTAGCLDWWGWLGLNLCVLFHQLLSVIGNAFYYSPVPPVVLLFLSPSSHVLSLSLSLSWCSVIRICWKGKWI
jgi:hypothetical protein